MEQEKFSELIGRASEDRLKGLHWTLEYAERIPAFVRTAYIGREMKDGDEVNEALNTTRNLGNEFDIGIPFESANEKSREYFELGSGIGIFDRIEKGKYQLRAVKFIVKVKQGRIIRDAVDIWKVILPHSVWPRSMYYNVDEMFPGDLSSSLELVDRINTRLMEEGLYTQV